MNKEYTQFLQKKVKIAENTGFEVSESDISDILKPHQKTIVKWALNGGRRALFEAFGLGKTYQQIEIGKAVIKHTGKPFLIGIPLAMKNDFIESGIALGIDISYARDKSDIDCNDSIFVTNYERIRDGKFDAEQFGGVSFDEASILRGLDTQTSDYILQHFTKVPYRFVATATPSPNEYTEILNYAQFLGIMDRGQALTRFFQRDSTKAGNLTLMPNRTDEFWLWVSSWAIFVTKPSDLGFDDTGYDMPEIKVNYHCVSVTGREMKVDRKTNQAKLYADPSASLPAAAKEKRESLPARMEKVLEIIQESPDDNFLIWHHLEDERKALERSSLDIHTVYGSQDTEKREQILSDFANGKIQYMGTKPEIAGSGCNFQRHCHRAIFMGIDYKFNDFIQAVHRIARFLQTKQVIIDIIYTDTEDQILKVLEAKWRRHNEMVSKLTDLIREHGLNNLSIINTSKRYLHDTRQEYKGKNFRYINNDCIPETANMAENSVGMILTSIPFGTLYEYTEKLNDLGHNDDSDAFWAQMDFLIPNLYKALQPGRVACIHVKDRIRYSYQTGSGFIDIDDFSGETVRAFKKHGFYLIGKHTITTDVVRENNQTNRLGWTEQCKDGSKMGCGMPEYLLVFRKPASDRSNGYADIPVTKDKNDYSCARWQVDAHAYWKSSGDRLLNPNELREMDIQTIMRSFDAMQDNEVYDYAKHIQIGETLEGADRLSRTFMMLAPKSRSEYVWTDVNRMLTLNSNQTRKKQEKHVCPLQFDIADRCITRYSNIGDVILDPFGGIGTTPFRAIKLKRDGLAIELNNDYYRDGVQYCKEAEMTTDVPTLFDLIAA